MLILARIRARLRDRSGFTLIEVLVAMLTGLIVTGALFAILEFATKSSAHLANVADATQSARVTMTRIVDQLHSSCVSSAFSPVIKGSTPNTLIFVNGYDEAETKGATPPAELPATAIHKDEIKFENGKLIDKTRQATSNVPVATAEKYNWSNTSTTSTIGENVSRVPEGKGEVPIFKYYAYNTSSSAGASEAASTLKETTLTEKETSELTETGAKTVAAVVVTFRTKPAKKEYKFSTAEEEGAAADLSTLNTFAFSAPNAESAITAGPCE
jgi:prepilin-type N-terminal cleavage/methylation domain-containing protein